MRYRAHPESAKRYTTVEIVIDERPIPGFVAPGDTDDETTVAIAVTYGESKLRQRVKQAGGRWDQDRKVWLKPYRTARQLGLHGRIKKAGD